MARRSALQLLVAVLVFASACLSERGTFDVHFGFRDGPPSAGRALFAFAYVERSGGYRVAQSEPVRFEPAARLQFEEVPNGDGYTVVVELKSSKDANGVTEYFGRSEPFSLKPGKHTSVNVALSVRPVPYLTGSGLRIVEAKVFPDVGAYVANRFVTLELASREATRVSIADNLNFQGAQTRRLSELEAQGDDVYLWRDWDLDHGVCSQLKCADGARELYVRFANDDNYQSSTYVARVELDTAPPGLSSSRLLSTTASQGEVVSVLVIAQEPLRAAPVITAEPSDFQLEQVEDASDTVPAGLSFTYQYTVDDRARDGQQYRFFAELVDLAGNSARVELADRVTIGSDLVALAATLERSPTFAPFAIAPFYSRTDPVTHAPVRAIVRVTSNRAFATTGEPPKLFGWTADGKQIELTFAAEQSDEQLAVFTHDFSESDAAGRYELQVEWTDEAGRAASSQLSPKIELRDDPAPKELGTIDTGLDAQGEPRTLLVARPWGHITDKGHVASSATLHGWVKQRAKRPEDCIAQVLVHTGTLENAAVRLDSLHDVAAVGGVTATGCSSEQASFTTHFAGQPGVFVFVTPVSVSGHLGPVQPVAHGEWVATLPPGNLGGTAQYPHALQALLRKPSVLYASGTSVELPASSSQLQDMVWEAQPAPTEHPEMLHQITPAYDPNRGRVLLTDNNVLSDVWELNGDAWTKHTTTSVTPKGGYLPLAFDSARDRLVCVGGGDWEVTSTNTAQTVNMNQTWEWDGSQWNHLQPKHHPPEGVRALAYDAARQLVVASPECSDALWLWNGVDWRDGPKLGVSDICVQALVYDHVHEQILAFGNDKQRTRLFSVRGQSVQELASAHRPPISEHVFAAYDSERDRLAVYNWSGGEPNVDIKGSEAWEWDGSDWTQPARDFFPRSGQFLLYDEAHKSLELFGGVTSADRFRLDDAGWVQLTGQKMPPPRTGQGMIYDTRRKALVIAGGHSRKIHQFETWERQGSAWLKVELDAGNQARFQGYSTPLVYDEARGLAVLPNPLFDHSQIPPVNLGTETIAFSGTTRTPVPVNAAMPGRVDAAAAYDAARERIVLFGGSLDSGIEPLADTWEWDGAQWTARQTQNAPAARLRHAMAFDRRRQRSVLFGGMTGNLVTLADTWEWDGSTWIERAVSNAPPAREQAALAYDEVRQKVVLFGGSLTQQGPTLNDTWEWDGESWTQVLPAQAPPARRGHSLAYDRDRARIVLFGGDDGGNSADQTQLGDAWEWDGAHWIERSVSEYLPSDNVGNTAYDARRGRLVMFGGYKYNAEPPYALDETWEWDGARWQQRMPKTVPPARSVPLMTFDETRQNVLMAGGYLGSSTTARDTWEWDGNDWLPLSAAADSFTGRMLALFHDRAEGKTMLVGDEAAWQLDGEHWTSLGSSASGVEGYAQTVYDAARQELIVFASDTLWSWARKTHAWTSLGPLASARDQIECLVYDDDRAQVLAITPSAFLESGMRVAALSGTTLDPFAVAGARDIITCNSTYDRKRKQIVMLVDGRVMPPPTPYVQTQLISRVEPAQRIDVDLTPLVGPARERAVELDGLAFHARSGADTGADGEAGVALDVWNGVTFRNVLENAADSGKPASLCFESSRPETLGGLEVDNQWHFLLRPSAESTGRQRAQLRTDVYEVRIRYHLGDAEPAIARGGDRACDHDGWAVRDFSLR